MNGTKVVNEEPRDERRIIGVVISLRTWKQVVRGMIRARDVQPIGWTVEEGETEDGKDLEE